MSAPIVVSYGGGTNSTAMLVGMHERGMRPALIMFADTGDEKPETYEHLDAVQLWLDSIGFPRIVVVRNELPQGVKDGSLYGQCMRLGTVPSKAFGMSSCSVKWKIEPQYRFLKRWMAIHALTHVEHWVGYDFGEIHRSQKATPNRAFETERYPLIEWEWTRDECVAAIARAGLKQPGKSACWHCPSSKKPEVLWLKQTHPDLYAKAIAMERRALAGEGQAPAARIDGLGRHWNWATFAGSDAATPESCMTCIDGDEDETPAGDYTVAKATTPKAGA